VDNLEFNIYFSTKRWRILDDFKTWSRFLVTYLNVVEREEHLRAQFNQVCEQISCISKDQTFNQTRQEYLDTTDEYPKGRNGRLVLNTFS